MLLLDKRIFFCSFVLLFFFDIYSASYSSCNLNIPSGNHFLTSDISSSSSCFRFVQNNSYLNCNGFRILGDGGLVDIGVNFNGFSNITVSNCKIENFGAVNILLSNTNAYLINSTLTKSNNLVSIGNCNLNGINSIYFENVTGYNNKYIYFVNDTIKINGWTNISSLVLCNAGDSVIENLFLKGNNSATAISVFQTNNLTIRNVQLNNFSVGINLNSVYNSSINNNEFNNNSNSGIYLDVVYDSTLDNNLFINSNGIQVYNTYDSFILNSDFFDNYWSLYFYFSYNNQIQNIQITSGDTGFGIDRSYNNIFSNIIISNLSNYGFYFSDTIENNIFSDITIFNSSYGVYIDYEIINNSFSDFTLTQNYVGFYVNDKLINSTILNFEVYNNTNGLYIRGWNGYESYGNVIWNSNFYDNSNTNLNFSSYIFNNTFYNNYFGDIGKVFFSEDGPVGQNFFDFAGIGNKYSSSGSGIYCFDSPTDLNCDNFPIWNYVISIVSNESSLSSFFPYLGFISSILIFLILFWFFL